jgi:hypothetical protein
MSESDFVRGWNAALYAIAAELDQQFALPYPRALARANVSGRRNWRRGLIHILLQALSRPPPVKRPPATRGGR